MLLTENKKKPPFVSIVMPIRNEESFIERGLHAIFAQKYPSDLLELIIADGESDDSTIEIIEILKFETDILIKLLNNTKRIAPSGLNLAIAEAKGEIIIRVDGHCEIEPEYVANCVKYLQSNQAEGVGGPIETIGETFLAKVIAVAMSSNFGVGGSAFRTIHNRQMFVDTVAFPGYTREIIEKVGFFNEELVRNQDDEFNFRIRRLGGRILLCPDIRSRYYSRSSFRALWRQYYQYGFWKVRVSQMHPWQMSLRQFVPFIFVSSLMIMALLSIFTRSGRWGLILIAGSYLGANLVSSLIISIKTRITFFPFLSLSFIILHISYGLGFLAGLIAFRNDWGKEKTSDLTISKL